MDGAASAMSPLDARLAAELERLRAQDLYRVRRIVEGGEGASLLVDGTASTFAPTTISA